MLGWMIRHPYTAAILIGIIVTGLFGWASFPREETIQRTVRDWVPDNFVAAGSARTELLDVLNAYNTGATEGVSKVSEKDFRDLDLAETYAVPAAREDEPEFRIQYVGRAGGGSGQVYVAERKIPAASSFSPDRWLYRAVEAEADEFGNVLRLTYERDLSGLAGLFVMDAIVGAFYAVVVGMILSVLGMEGLDKNQKPRPLPAPSPMLPINPRGIFRA